MDNTAEATSVAETIDVTEAKAKYDEACKQLLSEKIILAWIMKSCVKEYKDISINDIAEKYIEGTPEIAKTPVYPDAKPPAKIKGESETDKTVNEGTVTFDIRFYALAPKSGNLIRLILNVEAQNDFYPGYPIIKRAIYYCGRLISSQYEKEFIKSHYEDVKKVYSIWICANPPQYRMNTINRYAVSEENIVGEYKEKIEDYDLMTAVVICLGKPDIKNYGGILRLLEILLSNERSAEYKKKTLEQEFNIPMTTDIERKVNNMANLSDGIWEKGRLAGKEEEKEKTTLQNMRSIMETMSLTAEKAMEALKIPKSEWSKYISML